MKNKLSNQTKRQTKPKKETLPTIPQSNEMKKKLMKMQKF